MGFRRLLGWWIDPHSDDEFTRNFVSLANPIIGNRGQVFGVDGLLGLVVETVVGEGYRSAAKGRCECILDRCVAECNFEPLRANFSASGLSRM